MSKPMHCVPGGQEILLLEEDEEDDDEEDDELFEEELELELDFELLEDDEEDDELFEDEMGKHWLAPVRPFGQAHAPLEQHSAVPMKQRGIGRGQIPLLLDEFIGPHAHASAPGVPVPTHCSPGEHVPPQTPGEVTLQPLFIRVQLQVSAPGTPVPVHVDPLGHVPPH